MVRNELIDLGGEVVTGVEVGLPNAPLLMLVGSKGFVGCGYFKMEVAERFSHGLALVSGVRSFEDVLKAEITAVSPAAAACGVTPGMTGAEAARLLA